MSMIASLRSLPSSTKTLTSFLIFASSFLFLLKLTLPAEASELEGVLGDSAGQGGSLEYPFLVLVPAKFIFYPWTVLVAGFVETQFIEFFVSLLSLTLAGRYLERVWGQAEFCKFVVVVVGASNLIALAVNYIEASLLPNGVDRFLTGMSYHGLMGLQVGFLVAFAQLIPEHSVQVFGGLFKVRVRSLPMLYVTLSNVACLLGYQSPYILIQFGWFTSWFYLRFVKMNGEIEMTTGGAVRGDRSETFSLASWFPGFLQKYIRRITTLFFNLSVSLGLLRPWTDLESNIAGNGNGNFPSTMAGHVLGNGSFNGGTSSSGGARAEAERRRAMALKALDQRMASRPSTPVPTSLTPPAPLPSLPPASLPPFSSTPPPLLVVSQPPPVQSGSETQ